jgi:hypothetical protein
MEKGFILKSLYNPSILPENSQQDRHINKMVRSVLEKVLVISVKLL